MRGTFEDEETAPAPARRDTELTLGSGMLMVLFLALVVLCGVCFGAGYMMGHRGPETAPVAAQPDTAAAQPSGSSSKPAATTQAAQAQPAEAADSDQAAAQEPAAQAEAQSVPPVAAPAPTGAAQAAQAPMQVRAALGNAAPVDMPAAAAATAAEPGVGTLMVQIAAVSNAEDADVLTHALRKRGYAVTERREPVDNMIHVRIGPFATVAEANSWKLKLLSDGYNAEVQR